MTLPAAGFGANCSQPLADRLHASVFVGSVVLSLARAAVRNGTSIEDSEFITASQLAGGALALWIL